MGWFNKSGQADEVQALTAAADSADAPWVHAQTLHDDRFLRLAAHAANWRLFGFISLGIALVAVGGLVYQLGTSKYIPMVIEVDKLGQTVAVKALTGDAAVSDASRSVYREMFDLIENLRTVSTDRNDNNRRVSLGFSRLTGSAANYVRTELKKAPPNEVGATKVVLVKVNTALKLTGKSWQIDWEERSIGLNGEDLATELWRATLQYTLEPSGDAQAIRVNPIGFTVSDLSWQKVAL